MKKKIEGTRKRETAFQRRMMGGRRWSKRLWEKLIKESLWVKGAARKPGPLNCKRRKITLTLGNTGFLQSSERSTKKSMDIGKFGRKSNAEKKNSDGAPAKNSTTRRENR